MRKFFALALAVAMVLSLASVSFAAVNDPIDTNSVIALSDFHKYDGDDNAIKDAQAQYGKSYYAVLFEGKWINTSQSDKAIGDTTPANSDAAIFKYFPMTKYDTVEKLKVKAEFEMGEDLVESVSVVKKHIETESVYTPNTIYDAAEAADTNGSKWINDTGTPFADGIFYYIVDESSNPVVGTSTAGVALYGKDVAAADGDNGVIDMYDLYKVDAISSSEAGTEGAPRKVTLEKIAAAHTAVGGTPTTATVIPDEITGTYYEVQTVNSLNTGAAVYDGTDKRWEESGVGSLAIYNTPLDGYYYCIEVKTKAERVTGDADVIGTFEFNRKGKDGIAKIDDCEVDFAFNLFYEKNYNDNAAYKIDVEDSVEMKWDDLYVLKFDNDDEVEIEFGTEPNEGVFTVDVSGQGKLVIDFNTKANEAICAANEGVEMYFVNFNGAKFNRVGTFEYEMEDMVAAYKVEGDQLVEINGLEMDGDTATFSTRTLGNYVFANAELVNPTVAVEAPVVAAPAVTNPSTGA